MIRMMVVAALVGVATPAVTDAAGDVAAPRAMPIGLWRNPADSVRVRTAPCGDAMCGTIAAASAKAEADARDAGVDRLIGTELLHGYRQTGPGRWSGTVFVPDMGRSFSSRIEQIAPDALKISGCLIGGFLCKSQVWQRV